MLEVKDLPEIEVKMLTKTAKLPTRGSSNAAGYDLYADLKNNISIQPGTCAKIPTGLAMSIPNGYFGGIFPRSGLSVKQGLRCANAVGVLDEDYRGEIIVALYNDSDEEQVVTPNMRIAQLIILPYLAVDFTIVDDLDKTSRGEGGFGSTGTN